jgi:hypothetical protein
MLTILAWLIVICFIAWIIWIMNEVNILIQFFGVVLISCIIAWAIRYLCFHYGVQ